MGEWDMHDAGAAPVVDEKDRLPVGTKATGVVVCQPGLGTRLLAPGPRAAVTWLVSLALRVPWRGAFTSPGS
jgi:hypothetical protein